MKCPHCNKETELKILKIKELGIEVETNIHNKGGRLKDIEIPKGWRLLRIEEITFLYNNYEKELNMEDTWEFIKQPFKKNKDHVAWFGAHSGRACFNWDRSPTDSNASLGVRFCRDLKKGDKLI